MSTNKHHSKPVPYCDEYLNLLLRLTAATKLDMDKYREWVRANQVQLHIGFTRSGEYSMTDPINGMDVAVETYARMQYSRAMGLGV